MFLLYLHRRCHPCYYVMELYSAEKILCLHKLEASFNYLVQVSVCVNELWEMIL
ncbi:hypothetical protein OIU77_024447 [Salix suchowensis]|uniref:Uncharacterized protein n=1 Tax=Salix suchowensis TaxID=1278906 RepID=A0ABQ9BX10_9ROSI|nr:hypothetical protein OIU77_024447 [Salix suchowensis]